MNTAMDRSGRIVLPKPIRDRLGLRGGEQLEIEERDGVIEIRPATASIEIITGPTWAIARLRERDTTIDDTEVRATLDAVRQ